MHLRSLGGWTSFRGRALTPDVIEARAKEKEREREKNKQRRKSRRANRES